jgi:transposase
MIIRTKALSAIDNGMSISATATSLGISRQSIHTWMNRRQAGGEVAVHSDRRGRPKGTRLASKEGARIKNIVVGRTPDQLKLPWMLWTREGVAALILRQTGAKVSVWTVGRYLRSWNMSPQKPISRAFEQNPEAVKRWLEHEYPAIARQAKRDGAEIHWGDEMGLKSDHQTGTSWAERGHTPVIRGTGQRFGCNMISTVTNRGTLRFMIYSERFTTSVFITFLKRLITDADRMVDLIVDGHPVHRSKAVGNWLVEHEEDNRMHFLPAYSPELNPDERLNHDVNTNALGRQRPADRDEMISGVRSYVHGTQKRPDIVERYFNKEQVRYAKA